MELSGGPWDRVMNEGDGRGEAVGPRLGWDIRLMVERKQKDTKVKPMRQGSVQG